MPVPGPLKPLIPIPTTAGTGSEITGVSIFDYQALHAKTGIANRRLKPPLGYLDPENTRTMPPAVAASTGLDILSHANRVLHGDAVLRSSAARPSGDAAGVSGIESDQRYLVVRQRCQLLLARSAQRTREMAVRVSLGASRWRIVRQLLVESLVLSIASGLAGFALGVAGIRTIGAMLSDPRLGKPYWMTFTIDPIVIAFFAGISVATGVLFGPRPGAASLQHRRQ